MCKKKNSDGASDVWRTTDVKKYLDGKRKKNPDINIVSGKEEAVLRTLDQTH